MSSRTVVFVTVFLSALAIADKLECHTRYAPHGGEVYELCSSQLCFSTISADNEENLKLGCADIVPENKNYQLNHWTKNGSNYVKLCDKKGCNRIIYNDMEALKNLEKGKLVCYEMGKALPIVASLTETLCEAKYAGYNCVYTKNVTTNETLQSCMKIDERQRMNMGKCVKTGTQYEYICDTSLCNHARVCDEYVDSASGRGQGPSPGQDTKGLNETAVPQVTIAPENTGSQSNLPSIAISVLVVGIYFTV